MEVHTERTCVLLGIPDQSRQPHYTLKFHQLRHFIHVLSSSSFWSRHKPKATQNSMLTLRWEKNSSFKLQKDLYLVHSRQLYWCTERWETLQNSSTVFQNKHLRVSLPQSIKIGLKQKWYDTFFFFILMVSYL